MTPLDHLRLWFASLDDELQREIAFALVPALLDHFKWRRPRSEQDIVRALTEWLAPPKHVPRGIGKVLSFAATIDYVFGEARALSDQAAWERIKESWLALRGQHLGPDALDGWAGAALGGKLQSVELPGSAERAATRH